MNPSSSPAPREPQLDESFLHLAPLCSSPIPSLSRLPGPPKHLQKAHPGSPDGLGDWDWLALPLGLTQHLVGCRSATWASGTGPSAPQGPAFQPLRGCCGPWEGVAARGVQDSEVRVGSTAGPKPKTPVCPRHAPSQMQRPRTRRQAPAWPRSAPCMAGAAARDRRLLCGSPKGASAGSWTGSSAGASSQGRGHGNWTSHGAL